MPKKMAELVCSESDRRKLEQLANNSLEDARVMIRARILLACFQRRSIEEIAAEFQVSRSMIFRWRSRFSQEGIAGLRDKPRAGKPPIYNEEFEERVMTLLQQAPPENHAHWDGSLLAAQLHASDDAVWRVLRRHGVALARQRVWRVAAGQDLCRNYPSVAGLYIAPPVGMMAICKDLDRPNAGAAQVITRDKAAGEALQQAARQGEMTISQAVEILSVFRAETLAESRRSTEMIGFLDDMWQDTPKSHSLHVFVLGSAVSLGIMGWMAAHPNVEFHFYSSTEDAADGVKRWLPIEAAKGECMAMTRQVMNYSKSAVPFTWKKYGGREQFQNQCSKK